MRAPLQMRIFCADDFSSPSTPETLFAVKSHLFDVITEADGAPWEFGWVESCFIKRAVKADQPSHGRHDVQIGKVLRLEICTF
jgi:hypothetical protein